MEHTKRAYNLYEKGICKNCGDNGIIIEDDICEECADKWVDVYRHSPELCYKFTRKHNYNSSVDIDMFVAAMFDDDQINEILYRAIIEAGYLHEVDCSPFIEQDETWFYSQVIKGVDP